MRAFGLLKSPIVLAAGAISTGVFIFWAFYRRKRKEVKEHKHRCSISSSSNQASCSNESSIVERVPADEKEDVEDVFKLLHGVERRQGPEMGIVLPRISLLPPKLTKKDQQKTPNNNNEIQQKIPGSHLVYVKTFGCSHNSSDSEVMMGLLQSYGYRFTSALEDSDLCLINSCTVKNPSQEAFMTIVRKAKFAGKAVVVAGCVPQADRHLNGLEGISIIGTTQIERVVDVVEEALKGNVVRLLAKAPLPSLDIPKVRRNRLIEIIPISTGCLGACTYCKTKQARGHLGSYTTDAILNRIRSSVNEGVQQIWITSEDTGAYGIDLGTNIGKLLKSCVTLLEELQQQTGKRIMLRLGMTNPPYIKEHIEAVAEVLNHPNVFRFLHIPVQSGSTKVLKDMIRDYTIDDFIILVKSLIDRVPHITIATDIICGFPTERDCDHLETIDLIQKFKFPIVNISQFYPRPGTPAARMKRVPTQIVKKRSTEVSDTFKAYSCNDFLNGSIQRVWFSEIQADKFQSVGHTIHYIKVIVPQDPSLFGTERWVKISRTTKWHAEGEICESPLQEIDKTITIDEFYPN